MSANNQVVVKKRKEGWSVHEIDVDQQGWGRELRHLPSLEEATAFAQEYIDDNLVEYGMRIEQ